MFTPNSQTPSQLDGSSLKVGIVQARFNPEITDVLAKACLAELAAMGVKQERITHVFVPGALEIPLALQALAHIEEPEQIGRAHV